MSSTPHLSLPLSPSASIPDPHHDHNPPPLSATSPSTPSAQSVPSASTSAPAPPPSPSRLHRRRPPVVPLSTDEETAAARVSSRCVMRYFHPCNNQADIQGYYSPDRRPYLYSLPRCQHTVPRCWRCRGSFASISCLSTPKSGSSGSEQR